MSDETPEEQKAPEESEQPSSGEAGDSDSGAAPESGSEGGGAEATAGDAAAEASAGAGGADVLDQFDIDKLLEEGAAEPDGIVYRPNGTRYGSDEKVNIEFYDFRNPAFLTEVELRQIKIKHEKFIHYLAARLSLFLRMDFKLKLSQLHTLPYDKFTDGIESPTYISLFNIDELTGVGVVDFNTRLAMTMVNRMLGGRGHSIGEARYLTEIEMGLMDEIIEIVLNEWCGQWSDFKEFNVTLVGRENDGKFLHTAPRDANMLIIDVEGQLGDCVGVFQLAFPYYMLEPIVKDIQNKASQYSRIGVTEKESSWRDSYSDIVVPVYAEWESFDISVQDLLNLRPGDVFTMPRNMLEKTEVRLMNTPCFKGEVGVENDYIAIKIDKKIEQEESIWQEYQK